MIKKERLEKYILIIYFVIEIILYLSFLIIDLFFNSSLNNISSLIKYSTIILNLLFLIILSIFNFKIEKIIVIFAFIFTSISDYFLLFKSDNNSFLIGLITFNIVQLIYFFRFHFLYFSLKKFLLSLILRIIFIVSIILIIYFLLPSFYSLLNILALIYFINLIFNFLDPLINDFKNSKNQFLAIGFFLFILCDINVGIINALFYNNIISFLMRFFYLPSQVFLFYSANMDDKHIKNNQ